MQLTRLHSIGRVVFVTGLLLALRGPLVSQSRTLVWSDEFIGSTLDSTAWTFGAGAANDNLQYYTSRTANATIAGGALQLIAQKESYQGYAYTSALLQTRSSFSMRYGRVEARIKLPAGLFLSIAIGAIQRGEERNTRTSPRWRETDLYTSQTAERQTETDEERDAWIVGDDGSADSDDGDGNDARRAAADRRRWKPPGREDGGRGQVPGGGMEGPPPRWRSVRAWRSRRSAAGRVDPVPRARSPVYFPGVCSRRSRNLSMTWDSSGSRSALA